MAASRIVGPWQLLAAVAAAALVAVTPVLANGGTLVQISGDPYTNPGSQHSTQVEPDTFSYGSTVVSAFQTGRFFTGGASNIGFATSLDSGHTWHQGFLPGTTAFASPAGKYERVSDPSVAFDARDDVWLVSYLGLAAPVPPNTFPTQADVLVSRSGDGGLTWDKPVAIDARGSTSGQSLDKNWTVCDNSLQSRYFGACYTAYDNTSAFDLEQVSTSSDGGLTWSAAAAPADGAHGIGGQPLVRPNGVVVVPYLNLDVGVVADFISVDGGLSWSASTLISLADFHPPNGGLRAGLPLPTAEIDGSGRIYVAWSDCRFQAQCSTSDVIFSTSDDGVAWSPVHRVPIDPIGSPADHFIPGLAVDAGTPSESARLALTYYFYPQGNCGFATCRLQVGFITSTDGGDTWSTPETVAGPMSLGWLADTSQGRMAGDYISTSIAGGAAIPVFAAGLPPAGASLLSESMYTVGDGVARVRGGSLSSRGDRPVARPAASPARRPGRPVTAF
jgi:hypothetical protein